MEPKVYRAKISDLKTLGDKNPNKGTERGVYGVERSLEKNGAWRSIAATSDGIVTAGNHTLEAYAAQGNEDVLIVETDGDILVVAKRRDVASDDPRAKDYTIADNRTSEWGLDWSPEVIQGFIDEDIDLSDWFHDWELDKLFKQGEDWSVNYAQEWEGMPEFEQEAQLVFHTIRVHFMSNEDLEKFAALLGQKITKEVATIYYPARTGNKK